MFNYVSRSLLCPLYTLPADRRRQTLITMQIIGGSWSRERSCATDDAANKLLLLKVLADQKIFRLNVVFAAIKKKKLFFKLKFSSGYASFRPSRGSTKRKRDTKTNVPMRQRFVAVWETMNRQNGVFRLFALVVGANAV